MTPFTLARWYKANGVSYVKPKYHITNTWTEDEMLRFQQLTVLRLLHYMNDPDIELIFVDECK